MVSEKFDAGLRSAAAQWLDKRKKAGHDLVTYREIAQFSYKGERIPLMDRQRGIRKPRGLEAAISLRTTYTPLDKVPPYHDAEGPDGLLRYKYRGPRGPDPDHYENVALRVAWKRRLPLIWFVGIAPALYLPRYPVWIAGDERKALQFAVALDHAQLSAEIGKTVDSSQRAYISHLSKHRLHQPVFRAKVLHAYASSCAMCHLKRIELLDAAHILPDNHPRGEPVVPNGLCLCKIHHAAYDRDIIGVRPDLIVEVRGDILEEEDGPMLRYGLQSMNGVKLGTPRIPKARPDAYRLEERYEQFRKAR